MSEDIYSIRIINKHDFNVQLLTEWTVKGFEAIRPESVIEQAASRLGSEVYNKLLVYEAFRLNSHRRLDYIFPDVDLSDVEIGDTIHYYDG